MHFPWSVYSLQFVPFWLRSDSLKHVFKNIVPEFKIVNCRIISLVQTMPLSEAGVQRVIFEMIKLQRPELFAWGNFNEVILWKEKKHSIIRV